MPTVNYRYLLIILVYSIVAVICMLSFIIRGGDTGPQQWIRNTVRKSDDKKRDADIRMDVDLHKDNYMDRDLMLFPQNNITNRNKELFGMYQNGNPNSGYEKYVNKTVYKTSNVLQNTKNTLIDNSGNRHYITKSKSMNFEDVGRRLSEERAHVQAACSKVRTECSLENRIKYRNFFFHDYNTTVCTIAKSGSSTWRAHLRKVNGGPPPHLPVSIDARRDQFLARPYDLVVRDINASVKIITVRHPLTRLVSAYREKYKGGRIMPPNKPERERRFHKNHAGSYWGDRFKQFWLPALYTNGLIPADIHIALGLHQPIDPAAR
ncbi:putative Sulfotransferase domain-containing protein 7 [Homarus americanus]|uniref:Carbohydrate sulfotransferase n=2 Tax=Homarus americanus TaxID=6706 RepID=A0A8J5K668_HOMAM|nr:putative Sulfotransferase domain-containing protein 7 [Homarus americanus]